MYIVRIWNYIFHVLKRKQFGEHPFPCCQPINTLIGDWLVILVIEGWAYFRVKIIPMNKRNTTKHVIKTYILSSILMIYFMIILECTLYSIVTLLMTAFHGIQNNKSCTLKNY